MVIYKTTNLVNGKIYIGQDSKNNADYLGSGLILSRAINKYGIENFKKTVIETCDTKKELNECEIYWIDKLSATTIGYNIALGGSDGDTYTMNPNLPDIINKLSGENNHFYGKTHTEKSRRKMSESQIGREPWNKYKTNVYSDETITKMSETRSKLTGDTSSSYIHIDKNILESKLKDKTIKEVAEDFQVSISCIRRKISDYNLHITKKSGNFAKPLDKRIINKMVKLRGEGLTIVEIANAVGVGIHKTSKTLKNLN